MATPANLDWLFPVLGWTLAVGALGLLLWALFRDKGRGRRRCPKCWYDLEGTPGLVCSECGNGARSERQLFKSRRRWRWAALAASLLIISAVVGQFPSLRLGWERIVPSALLVSIARATDPIPAPLTSAGISAQQIQAMIAQNPSLAPQLTALIPAPPTPPTIGERLTAEVWRRLQGDDLPGWAARSYVSRYLHHERIDLARCVYLPDRWPLDQPLIAHMDAAPIWQGANFQTRVYLPGDRKTWIPDGAWGFLAPQRSPVKEVEVEVELHHWRTLLHRTRVRIPCTVEGDVSTFLHRETGPGRDADVREALAPSLIRLQDGGFGVRYHDRSTKAPWPRINYGVAFTAELHVGDRLIAHGSGMCEWARPVWKDWEDIPLTWEPGGAELAAGGQNLTLRITGDPRAAGLEFVTRRYGVRPACWFGSFDLSPPLPP